MTETNKPYRVAQSAADTRQRWLQERRTGIGGSDAAVVLGLSPWKSRYELWAEKSGSVPDEDKADSPHLDLGNNLEAVVLRLLALRTGRHVEAAERFKLVRHPEHAWLFCTPDGWEHDQDICEKLTGEFTPYRGIVQAKTAFAMNKHDWDVEPPDYYRVQLQHEMLASGCAWGTLCVLFIDQGVLTRLLNASFGMVYDASRLACAISDHCDFRFFDYEADAEFQADLLAAEQAFMGLIDAGVAPSTDESESCRRAIHRLHPRDSGASVNLPDEWIEHTARLAELKSQKSITEKEIGELENALKALIGDATYGVLPDGSRWAWKTQNRKEYVVAASELRVLRKEKGKA